MAVLNTVTVSFLAFAFVLFSAASALEGVRDYLSISSVAGVPFNYFVFAQQLPKATCYPSTQSRCRNNPGTIYPTANYFTIHGLWPSYKSPRAPRKYMHPSHCHGRPKFNYAQINRTLYTKLVNSWPDVEYSNNWGFWIREYNKHGTCANIFQSQSDYFERSYQLWLTYNITKMFYNTNNNIPAVTKIQPGNSYEYDQFEDAIKPWIDYKIPIISCKPLKNGGQILLEVFICFNKTTTGVIDCPGISNCKSQLITFYNG